MSTSEAAKMSGTDQPQGAMQQAQQTDPNIKLPQSEDPAKTGVGPRGTKVAPSTNPSEANSAAPPQPNASNTGVGAPGGKAGPTALPGETSAAMTSESQKSTQ